MERPYFFQIPFDFEGTQKPQKLTASTTKYVHIQSLDQNLFSLKKTHGHFINVHEDEY